MICTTCEPCSVIGSYRNQFIIIISYRPFFKPVQSNKSWWITDKYDSIKFYLTWGGVVNAYAAQNHSSCAAIVFDGGQEGHSRITV